MFGSGFDLGFSLSDVTAQVVAFLGNAMIVGLIATSLALVVIPRILRVVKSSLGTGSLEGFTEDEISVAKSIGRHYRRHGG
jgi:hypothetical protein